MNMQGAEGTIDATIRDSFINPSSSDSCGLLEEEEGLCLESPNDFTSTETFGPTHTRFNQPTTTTSTSTSPLTTVSSTTTTSTTHASSNSAVSQSVSTSSNSNNTQKSSTSSTVHSATPISSTFTGGVSASLNSSSISGSPSSSSTLTTKTSTSVNVKAPTSTQSGVIDTKPKPASLLDHKGTAAGVFAAIVLGIILFVVLLGILFRVYRRSRRRKARQAVPYSVEETEATMCSQNATGQGESEQGLEDTKQPRILVIEVSNPDTDDADSMRVSNSHSIGNPPPYVPSEAGEQEKSDLNIGNSKEKV